MQIIAHMKPNLLSSPELYRIYLFEVMFTFCHKSILLHDYFHGAIPFFLKKKRISINYS